MHHGSLLPQLLFWEDYFALQPILVLFPLSCLVLLFMYPLHYVTCTPAAPELPLPAFRDHSAFPFCSMELSQLEPSLTPTCFSSHPLAQPCAWQQNPAGIAPHWSGLLTWGGGLSIPPAGDFVPGLWPACGIPHGTLVLGVIPVLSLLRHTRLLVESEIKITSLFLAIPRVLCTTPFGIIFVVEDFSPIPSLFLFLSAFVFRAWASVSKSCLECFLACHPVSHEAEG